MGTNRKSKKGKELKESKEQKFHQKNQISPIQKEKFLGRWRLSFAYRSVCWGFSGRIWVLPFPIG
jgi:hypothetical protein